MIRIAIEARGGYSGRLAAAAVPARDAPMSDATPRTAH